ncbi:MAG: PEP/pyruvate-binding domain-containing protein, partial [bacterium]
MSELPRESSPYGGVPEADHRPTSRDYFYLMKFRVTKILLISSLYDAFTLEEEGLLMEQISSEYRDLALSSPPQVVRVSTGEEALRELRHGRYDLVITMSQVVDLDPCKFCAEACSLQPDIPVVLLAAGPDEFPVFRSIEDRKGIDKVFYWTGDSTLFLAITKYIEDKANVTADSRLGTVKAILVIEDSPMDYSAFLPVLYTEVMRQTQALIAEGLNEQEKWFRKKSRPKILLAETFDEARTLYEKYKKSLLGIITDVTYPRDGKVVEDAGFQFIEEVVDEDLPILVQSRQSEHKKKADRMGVSFREKNAETAVQGIRSFLKQHLGFGDFVFLLPGGSEVARVSEINEFVDVIQRAPLESIRYHAQKNDFSRWLLARGETTLALELKPKRVSDFKDDAEMREYLVGAIRKSQREKRLGIITDFAQETFEFEETFNRLGGGSLGGKGRGLAFLAQLLHHSDVTRNFADCAVRLPSTLVLGTDIFDAFMASNNLSDFIAGSPPDTELNSRFSDARLPDEVTASLKVLLRHVHQPLAVRSSSLLEDSQSQPFAGVYATYMLPNNCDDESLRLEQLCQAVKLVYASTFSERARAYTQSVVPGAQEKMAVLIQKLVGGQYGNRFYPIYSGVGQSANFYPVSPLKREDGIVSVALGLGRIVVEGGKVLSFSPAHPAILPGLTTPEEIADATQSYFYALDLEKTHFDLKNGEETTLRVLQVPDAEGDGTLRYVASTYDVNDNRLRDGVGSRGPRVVTFAGIRKYDMLPFGDVVVELLSIGEKGMGRPVEIEFAGAMAADGSPEFYVLQIRPLVTLHERQQVVIDEADQANALISATDALGNGMLEGITDIVMVSPDTFDPTRTVEIAAEVSEFNRSLDGTPYILIGPGRWGTRDRFAGIPVKWHEISWARTIVETALEGFSLSPSQGTHFF